MPFLLSNLLEFMKLGYFSAILTIRSMVTIRWTWSKTKAMMYNHTYSPNVMEVQLVNRRERTSFEADSRSRPEQGSSSQNLAAFSKK